MIPIGFRLDNGLKIDYIEKMKTIIDDADMCKLSQRIYVLIRVLRSKGFSDYEELLDYAEDFQGAYPNSKYFCMWILLSFDQINRLASFIRNNYINPSIDSINLLLNDEYESVKSHTDLRIRRKKYKYPNDADTRNLINSKRKYDVIFNSFKECINIYDKEFSTNGINAWIIEKTGMTV